MYTASEILLHRLFKKPCSSLGHALHLNQPRLVGSGEITRVAFEILIRAINLSVAAVDVTLG